MKRLLPLLIVLALPGVCKGQTVLGKHPKDTVLPNFFNLNGNADATITGLNSYGTLPLAPAGGLTLGGVTRHTWPTGGAWDVPETILTNWEPNVFIEHSLNLVGGHEGMAIAMPGINFVWANGDGTTNSFWLGLMGANGLSFSGPLTGDGSGLYNLPIPDLSGLFTNGQVDAHFPGLTIDNANGSYMGETDTAWLWFRPTGLGAVPGNLSLDPAGFHLDRPLFVSGTIQASGVIVGETGLDEWASAKVKAVADPLYDPLGAAQTEAQEATNGWPWLVLSDPVNAAHNATNGLGSAAFQSSSAFDTAGAGTTAAQNATNGLGSAAFKASTAFDASGAAQNATNGLGSAAFQSATAFDAAGAGTTAAQNATNHLSQFIPTAGTNVTFETNGNQLVINATSLDAGSLTGIVPTASLPGYLAQWSTVRTNALGAVTSTNYTLTNTCAIFAISTNNGVVVDSTKAYQFFATNASYGVGGFSGLVASYQHVLSMTVSNSSASSINVTGPPTAFLFGPVTANVLTIPSSKEAVLSFWIWPNVRTNVCNIVQQ